MSTELDDADLRSHRVDQEAEHQKGNQVGGVITSYVTSQGREAKVHWENAMTNLRSDSLRLPVLVLTSDVTS